MRFRAKIESECLNVLHNLLTVLSKCSESCALFLNEESVKIVSSCHNTDAVRCFMELRAGQIFSEYRIESQSSNTILFELNIELLAKSLASGRRSPLCQLKLVKRGSKPCLCFEAKSMEGLSIDIVHDIPINLMKSADVVYYVPPEVPPPKVCLELPRSKLLRNIIERMGKQAKYVDVTVSQVGRLCLQIDHATASITTFYNGLSPRFEGSLDAQVDAENSAVVKVELKKLGSILNLGNLMIQRALLFVSPNAVLVVHISLSPMELGSMTYYCPIVVTD